MPHFSWIKPCDVHSKWDCSHGQLGLSSDSSSYVTFAQRINQMAHMDLETFKYHQGSCSVDEYVNDL